MLAVDNLTARFPNATHPVLDNIEFTVESGEIVSVIGRSGSGKSTLLRSLAGLQPHSGTLHIHNTNYTQTPANKRNIGWVDQASTLLPHLSISQNIELPLKLHKVATAQRHTQVADLLEQFNISHLAHNRPHHISGGEQQRVALARAIIYAPQLLLLDEPFGALDAITRFDLTTWLNGILAEYKITTLLVTHDIREAQRLTKRALVLDHGSLISDGSWEQLATSANSTVQGLLATTSA